MPNSHTYITLMPPAGQTLSAHITLSAMADDHEDTFIEEEEECNKLSDAEQHAESCGQEIPEGQEAQHPDPTQRRTN